LRRYNKHLSTLPGVTLFQRDLRCYHSNNKTLNLVNLVRC